MSEIKITPQEQIEVWLESYAKLKDKTNPDWKDNMDTVAEIAINEIITFMYNLPFILPPQNLTMFLEAMRFLSVIGYNANLDKEVEGLAEGKKPKKDKLTGKQKNTKEYLLINGSAANSVLDMINNLEGLAKWIAENGNKIIKQLT